MPSHNQENNSVNIQKVVPVRKNGFLLELLVPSPANSIEIEEAKELKQVSTLNSVEERSNAPIQNQSREQIAFRQKLAAKNQSIHPAENHSTTNQQPLKNGDQSISLRKLLGG